MRKFNIMSLLLAVVAVLSFGACQHEYADWAPGAKDNNMGVFFPNTDDFTVAATDTSVKIEVKRTATDEAASVSLRSEVTTEDASELFTIPESIAFAAGSDTSVITISFDGSALTAGVKYAIRIKLEEKQASSYAVSENTFRITLPEPWNPMGRGIYVDEFLNILDDTIPAGLSTYVDFEVHADNPNRIRVVNPFSMAVFGNMWGGVPGYLNWTSEENHYLEFDITDPTNVLVETFYELPFQINFSDAGLLQAYMLIDTNEDGSYVEPVVLENGIIKFPAGCVAMVYPYNGQLGGWYANEGGNMMYALPGTELTDYTLSPVYAGMVVSADNTTSSAIIEFAVGADVESFKFVVVPGAVEDVEAVAATIVDGSAENIINSVDGQVVYQVELTTGTYTVVAVPYAGGEAVGTPGSFFFYYPGVGAGETPEVSAQFIINSLAGIFADDADRAAQMEANYPAEYYVGIVLGIENPSEVTGMRFYYNDRNVIENAIKNGNFASYDEIVDEYGNNVYAWVEAIANSNVRILNLPAGSDNCYIFAVDTIYGTTQYYHYDYAMPAYSGSFALNEYAMTDGEYTANVEFSAGTDIATVFAEFSFLPGFQFYATFDEDAQTLVLDGWAYGYEQYESLFSMGLPVKVDDSNPYSVFVAAEDAELSTPAEYAVIKCENNAPVALDNVIAVLAADASLNTTGVVYKFTDATTFSPAAATASLVYDAEFKSINVETESVMVEVARQPIVVKPYDGEFVREFTLTSKPSMIF